MSYDLPAQLRDPNNFVSERRYSSWQLKLASCGSDADVKASRESWADTLVERSQSPLNILIRYEYLLSAFFDCSGRGSRPC